MIPLNDVFKPRNGRNTLGNTDITSQSTNSKSVYKNSTINVVGISSSRNNLTHGKECMVPLSVAIGAAG